MNRQWSELLGAVEPGDGQWIRPLVVASPNDFHTAQRHPLALPSVGGRRVWLVNSGGRSGDLEWLLSGIVEAIRQVTTTAGPARHGRGRQLVAMPMFGVGDGGFGDHRGAVINGLLAALSEHLDRPEAPDVVLVVNKRADYAATQSLRKGAADDPRLLALAERVRRGGLVLFIGSGASAGLVSPRGPTFWRSWLIARAWTGTYERLC